jgi:AAA15 family ATPase/GTPase
LGVSFIRFVNFVEYQLEFKSQKMLNHLEIKNFGPLNEIIWNNLSQINLVIGPNDSGKTFLLKTLYTAMRTLEEYKRGNEPKKDAEILAEKLYWTFQPDKIGDLVKTGKNSLSCQITVDQQKFSYEFGKNTSKRISAIENNVNPRSSNSIFFPAKEVLSLDSIILKSREQDKTFGFDDTYLDLVRALRQSSKSNHAELTPARQKLEEILEGKVQYDDVSGRWELKKSHHRFSIGVTGEGIKNIAILDNLLSGQYLDNQSIIFIDELESALHPQAISQFLESVALLSECGMQFFLASHSYFVVKKCFLLAQQKKWSIPVISANQGEWQYADLKNGMPTNPIIDESIRLYREEVELALQ